MAAASNDPSRKLTLTARQDRVAALLATGRTVAAAAREVGVSTVTIWAWHKLPHFKERVTEYRRELTDRAIARLADMMASTAADTLQELASNPEVSASTRLDAAKSIYDIFVNVNNAQELQARIEQLEANQR